MATIISADWLGLNVGYLHLKDIGVILDMMFVFFKRFYKDFEIRTLSEIE